MKTNVIPRFGGVFDRIIPFLAKLLLFKVKFRIKYYFQGQVSKDLLLNKSKLEQAEWIPLVGVILTEYKSDTSLMIQDQCQKI